MTNCHFTTKCINLATDVIKAAIIWPGVIGFLSNAQMLVTTPEKWDVISRKGLGDASLVQALKLLIIDEIHLLHEDRGAVIEALVARTLRQVGHSPT